MLIASAQDAIPLVRMLEKTVRLLSLYPAQHPHCTEALDASAALLREYHDRHGALGMELRRDGIRVDDEQLTVTREGGALDLGQLLYPEGVRSLALEQGLERDELAAFLEALAGAAVEEDEEEPDAPRLRRDLLSALQRRELPHVQYMVYDPLSPAGVQAERFDPTVAPVAERIRELHTRFEAWIGDAPEVDALLERAEPDLGSERELGAFPEWRSLFADTEAGRRRAELLEGGLQASEDRLRAARIALEAAAQMPGVLDDAVLHLLNDAGANLVVDGQLDRASELLDLTREASPELADALAAWLGDARGLALLASALPGDAPEEGAADPSAGELLKRLGRGALPHVVAVYTGSAPISPRARAAFRALLAGHASKEPALLAELVASPREEIARDGLALLLAGGRGTPGWETVQKIAADAAQPHAALAREHLEELSGDRERGRLLAALEGGEEKTERVAAWIRLRDLPRHHETFGRISAVVSASAFVNRDDDEVREAFETLCLLGRRHAAPILRELAQRRPLLRRARTLAVGKLAAARLQKLTGEKL